MSKFTFFWLNGTRDVLEGQDAADAMNKAGYGAGAVPALDFHTEGDNNSYSWFKGEGWVNKMFLGVSDRD